MSGGVTQSLGALVRQAQAIVVSRAASRAPLSIWQAPEESDSDFRVRVARIRTRFDPSALLLAVCEPQEALAPPGVRWVELPPKMLRLLNPALRTRYRVGYGGRGAGRSWSFARGLILRAIERPLRVLCGRELQGSIGESVHRLLADQIEALGLSPWFDVGAQTIAGTNGSDFIFSGVRNNVSKLKSTEGVDIFWGEEAEKFSDYSWGIVVPTIRKRGSEIWATFNPDQADDPTYARFVTSPPPNALVEFADWRDNPWFPAELEAERAYLERVDPDAHAWIWGGQCRSATDAQVFRNKFFVEAFEPVLPALGEARSAEAPRPWGGPYLGADWGFSQDPTTLVKCWVNDRTLYIEHEAYGIGVDIDRTPALFDRVPASRSYAIRADSARPETISYMQQHGYSRVVGVEKWKGSVEDGIAHIRQYERVVIHPRCVHAIEEFRLYSYKIDRLSGDVLADVEDQHNHVIDAIRYALQPIIRSGNSGWLRFVGQELDAMRAQR